MLALRILTTWLERARRRRQLLQLTDVLLEDLGVDRADVWQQARKPFWQP